MRHQKQIYKKIFFKKSKKNLIEQIQIILLIKPFFFGSLSLINFYLNSYNFAYLTERKACGLNSYFQK
ncbi:hypothetical protein BpHYR1_021745 [Brachionus plicatilis]|uniref:Transmembrane protein n=1 Tax=Brachionus plicatilis TaxID=10195 RepID=A0A3M7SXD0_BRAPC|nr:hypothetical protein BpHYR1_021745 [Brachionus plicatilis]